MGNIINLNKVENIIWGRGDKPVIAAYNVFMDNSDGIRYGGEIYNKNTFDWMDGGRYLILTDENFEEIKAQTGKRISKIRFNYNNAYKKLQSTHCGCNLIDLETGSTGWGQEWVAIQWVEGILLQTHVDGNLIDIRTKVFMGRENLDKLSDGIYEFSYPDNKNVWFNSMEDYFNNLAVAFLIEDI